MNGRSENANAWPERGRILGRFASFGSFLAVPSAVDQRFGDLDGVERRAFAQVVGHTPRARLPALVRVRPLRRPHGACRDVDAGGMGAGEHRPERQRQRIFAPGHDSPDSGRGCGDVVGAFLHDVEKDEVGNADRQEERNGRVAEQRKDQKRADQNDADNEPAIGRLRRIGTTLGRRILLVSRLRLHAAVRPHAGPAAAMSISSSRVAKSSSIRT